VPGWDPELLHPPGVEWEEGLVFRTREESGGATEATVTCTFIGLSERGNHDIIAMSQADYLEKMARWERWIRESRGR